MIRTARPEDAAAIAAIYAPFVETTAISFEETAPTVDEMQRRMVATMVTLPYLVKERDGRVIGYAYASPHRQRSAYRFAVDVTVYVGPAAQRMGAARGLYRELIGRLHAIGMHRAYAGIPCRT